MKCKSDGKFDTPSSPLKKCEKPANCTATVPVPPVSQGNSTGQVDLDPAKTVPVTVVDYAEYFCNDTTYYAGKRTKSKIYHPISRTFTMLKQAFLITPLGTSGAEKASRTLSYFY